MTDTIEEIDALTLEKLDMEMKLIEVERERLQDRFESLVARRLAANEKIWTKYELDKEHDEIALSTRKIVRAPRIAAVKDIAEHKEGS